MHQNSAGASENMQADYKAKHDFTIHESISMVDEVVNVCAAHPRVLLTSQTCLADLQ